jgi:predicted TIM-barrel fold metal-dependent hydrolase
LTDQEVRLHTNKQGFRREVSAPRLPAVPGACDTHMHIVGPLSRYPLRDTRTFVPPEALLEDYLRTAALMGTERMVIVQPSFFGTDNACTLDAVGRAGDRARAVVVIDPEISDEALKDMHARGARGVRLQVIATGGLSLDLLEHVAKRIQPFGWHVQLYMDARNLPPLVDRLKRLPVDVVFDHMAHVIRTSGEDDPGFDALLDLMKEGRAWTKLSNAVFPPSSERARRLIDANPERVVWGSDWPHVAYSEATPDDGALMDLMADWAQDEKTRRQVLADNATRLYFSN